MAMEIPVLNKYFDDVIEIKEVPQVKGSMHNGV